MFYYVRVIITIIWAYIEAFIQRRKRKDVSTQTHFEMKTFVHLWDLDLYMHMNNAQYLAIFELARYDLMVKLFDGRLFSICSRGSWTPVIADVTVSYRRSLLPFVFYTVHSDIVGIGEDKKSFFIQQRIVTSSGIAALALFRLVFTKPHGIVTIDEFREAFGDTFSELPFSRFDEMPAVWKVGAQFFSDVKERVKELDGKKDN